MKSLVVEDDPICSRVLKSILSRFGDCAVANDGSQAVDAFANSLEDKRPYDLICMDIMMPEMNGHEALSEIRRLEEIQGIDRPEGVKVIMTTCLDGDNDKQQAFRSGCNAYMIKPIQRESLKKQVQSLGLILD
ncbi:MAG: response regulator [Sedimentisphaerales bacterium]|nr:response regulator [Sedimentisphaerales bacterium]